MPERLRTGAEAHLLRLSAQIEKRMQAAAGLSMLSRFAAPSQHERMARVMRRLEASIAQKRLEQRRWLAILLTLDNDAVD